MQSASSSSQKNSFDIIIVGGGIYGISIAYYLSKNPNIKTLLIEQYQIGNELGSSHSPTRITRSTYEKEIYRDLNLQALSQNWKEMENVLNHKFVYGAPYIYFDNQQDTFEECKNVAVGKENFAFLTGEEVCQKYKAMPLFKSNFPAIVDLKAGMLAADDYIQKLRGHLISNWNSNLTVLQNTKVSKIEESPENVNVLSSDGESFSCKKIVIASGKWLSELVPQMKNHVNVIKQYVSYLQMKDMPKYNISCFNSFSFKETDTMHTFIMPDHKEWGLKLVRHNLYELKPQEDNLEYQTKWIEAKARQFFGDEFIKINKIENCYYTITPTHDFILDYLNPETNNIFIVSCCSGHGFKFAPIIGDIAAQIVSLNKESNTTNQAYNTWKHLFKFPYHQEKGLF